MCLVKTSLRFSTLRNNFAVLTRGLDLVELTSRNVYCEDTREGTGVAVLLEATVCREVVSTYGIREGRINLDNSTNYFMIKY